jgi:hypothetical protein
VLNGIGGREPLQFRREFRADDTDPGAGSKERKDLALCDLATAGNHASPTIEINGYRQVTH